MPDSSCISGARGIRNSDCQSSHEFSGPIVIRAPSDIEQAAEHFPLPASRGNFLATSRAQTSSNPRFVFATTQRWLQLFRGHWEGVEFRNHWRRDALMGEDRSPYRNANLPANRAQ